MDNAYANALEALDYLAAYITFNSSFLDDTQLDRLKFFLYYSGFAASAVRVRLITSLYIISESVFFWKTSLPDEYKITKLGVESAIRDYEQNVADFDVHADDLKELDVVHEDFFNYHGYTLDKKTGKISKDKPQ